MKNMAMVLTGQSSDLIFFFLNTFQIWEFFYSLLDQGLPENPISKQKLEFLLQNCIYSKKIASVNKGKTVLH